MSNQYRKEWLELSPRLYDVFEKIAEYSIFQCITDICPAPASVFRAFDFFSPSDTRVVILGQDPYHSVIQGEDYSDGISIIRPAPIRKASGLAFGYHPEWPGPLDSSLHNIIAELGSPAEFDRSLSHWAEQGVLLLNTRLTCEAGKPMSHAGEFPGWEKPIQELIRQIDRMHREQMIWMLWGSEAQRTFDKALGIGRRGPTSTTEPELHGLQIRTTHPCRFSHDRGERAFTGSQCFELANRYLRDYAKRGEVQWTR